MSLKLENLLVNFGVSEEAIDILLLKEPFEWENTTKAIYEVEEKLNNKTINDTTNIVRQSKKS